MRNSFLSHRILARIFASSWSKRLGVGFIALHWLSEFPLICFGHGSGRKCWIPLHFGFMESVCGLGFEVLCSALILWVGRVNFENGAILTRLVGFVLTRAWRKLSVFSFGGSEPLILLYFTLELSNLTRIFPGGRCRWGLVSLHWWSGLAREGCNVVSFRVLESVFEFCRKP